jgi:hypothetical protein
MRKTRGDRARARARVEVRLRLARLLSGVRSALAEEAVGGGHRSGLLGIELDAALGEPADGVLSLRRLLLVEAELLEVRGRLLARELRLNRLELLLKRPERRLHSSGEGGGLRLTVLSEGALQRRERVLHLHLGLVGLLEHLLHQQGALVRLLREPRLQGLLAGEQLCDSRFRSGRVLRLRLRLLCRFTRRGGPLSGGVVLDFHALLRSDVKMTSTGAWYGGC